MLTNKNILDSLCKLRDSRYKNFIAKLIPDIPIDSFIGVRTPRLRQLAKDIIKSGIANKFIVVLPHKFFEENQLHAFILSCLSDFEFVIQETDCFLPYVDNWATCDQLSPHVFKKNKDILLKYVLKWVKSKHIYTVRFGIKMLMQYWMGDDFDEKYVKIVVNIKSDEYYVNMMRAWYFATGLAKHYNRILQYLQKLDDWTRKRAIQKALESFCVSDEHKKELRSLK